MEYFVKEITVEGEGASVYKVWVCVQVSGSTAKPLAHYASQDEVYQGLVDQIKSWGA